jgi:signal transduction histidine kinase
MRVLFLLIASLSTFYSVAQDYRLRQYRVEDGLPGDIIKAMARDTSGFIWIATDDGLVKYDGIRFTTYKSALQSQFVKKFLLTSDRRLIVIADLDVVEIRNQIDTVIFHSLIKGTRNRTDSTINYPRNIYEDKFGVIWLAEPQSLVKYFGGRIERFDLGPENRSPVFIRSFTFFENDNGVLFAVSYEGQVFYYDREENRFTQLPDLVDDEARHVLYHNSTLWIAGAKGLYQATSSFNQISKPSKIFDIEMCLYMEMESDSVLWLTTYNDTLHRLELRDKKWTQSTVPFLFNDANHIYVSDNHDLWISTDKGVVLLQEKIFSMADKASETHFIESITEDEANERIYYCTKEFVIRKNFGAGGERKVIINNQKSYFQFVKYKNNRLWLSDRQKLYLLENERVVKEWDFSAEGNLIHDLFIDSEENLWISQEVNTNAIVITKDLEVKRYSVPLFDNEVNVIREGKRGMYVASNGIDQYLFYKGKDGDFRNISAKPQFDVRGQFSINNFIVKDDKVWLASTAGLLLYKDSTLTRVDLGERFTELPVSAVEVYDDNNILFSNSNGLFRYNANTKEFWLYDENNGLPSNTITRHGVYIDQSKGLWIGTSYGLSYTNHLIGKSLDTPKPYCVEAKVNGTSRQFSSGLSIPYGSFVDLQFTSITFPEKVDVQWRFSDGDKWHAMESGKLTLTDLNNGSYVIHVRAKNLAHNWSDEYTFGFIVERPYWQTASFVIAILVLVAIIAWMSYMVSSYMLEKRKRLLQNLVDKRTHELQEVNRELMLRNTELDRFVYSASHDLSAPLKSLMGLINVARMENPGQVHDQYLRLMERSILKLDQFIREVVSYSRNSRMPLKPEAFNFKEFVEGLLSDFQYSPNFDKIKFIIEDHAEGEIVCDATRLKIILNNLVSNAIHFHRTYGNITPFIRISLAMSDGFYVIRVEDNGKGISRAHINKIFDMFYRASEDSQGSGLGLYILKESVTKMDGAVTVTSEIDHGTTFIIKLPVPLTTNVVRSTGS